MIRLNSTHHVGLSTVAGDGGEIPPSQPLPPTITTHIAEDGSTVFREVDGNGVVVWKDVNGSIIPQPTLMIEAVDQHGHDGYYITIMTGVDRGLIYHVRAEHNEAVDEIVYYNMMDESVVDISTLGVAGTDFIKANLPVRLRLDTINISAVTNIPTPLPAIPSHSNYAEFTVSGEDINFTVNSTSPSTSTYFAELESLIKLEDIDEMAAFNFISTSTTPAGIFGNFYNIGNNHA